MSQSSLDEDFKDAGIPVKRGVKVVAPSDERVTAEKSGSNIWMFRWAKNSYRNYPVVSRAKGVRQLAGSATKTAAIIVGVGPSLDAEIASFPRAAGRAVVISTDAAFRPLMARGIRPDIMISYDCKPEQKLLWEDVPAHDVPAIFDSCAHPDTIASWMGPVLFYNHHHQADELSHLILPHVFSTIGQIPSGGTVGNAALLFAKICGFAPILAVGMDFCYAPAPGGWTYRAQDFRFESGKWSPFTLKTLYDNDERVGRSFTLTIKGKDFRVDPELRFYHETFVRFVTHFNIDTVNCSPLGSLRDVIQTLPLIEAVDRYCPALRAPIMFDAILHMLGPDPRNAP